MHPDSPPLPPEPLDTEVGVAVADPPSPAPTTALVLSEAEIADARDHVEAFRATSTLHAYAADWRRFSGRCYRPWRPARPGLDGGLSRNPVISGLVPRHGCSTLGKSEHFE